MSPWARLLHALVIPLLMAGSDKSCDDAAKNKSTQVWKKEKYPNPQHGPDLERCGRNKMSWVCDPDSVITTAEADHLDSLLEEVRQNTTCTCPSCEDEEDGSPPAGFNIAVAFVNVIHDGKNGRLTEYEKLKETQQFAHHLQEKSWNFGHCDNDAIILVAIDYRKAWTSSGLRFQDHLDDWCVNHIYKQIRHELWGGNYTAALSTMITEYGGVLRGSDACTEGISAGRIIFILAMTSFGMCFVISVISFFKQRCENRPVRV